MFKRYNCHRKVRAMSIDHKAEHCSEKLKFTFSKIDSVVCIKIGATAQIENEYAIPKSRRQTINLKYTQRRNSGRRKTEQQIQNSACTPARTLRALLS